MAARWGRGRGEVASVQSMEVNGLQAEAARRARPCSTCRARLGAAGRMALLAEVAVVNVGQILLFVPVLRFVALQWQAAAALAAGLLQTGGRGRMRRCMAQGSACPWGSLLALIHAASLVLLLNLALAEPYILGVRDDSWAEEQQCHRQQQLAHSSLCIPTPAALLLSCRGATGGVVCARRELHRPPAAAAAL